VSVAGVAVSVVIVILAFFIFFETEGTATTEAEAAAAMDAGVAFSIAFLVGLFNLRGRPNLSEDTLEVVEAAVAETAASAEPAVAATVGSNNSAHGGGGNGCVCGVRYCFFGWLLRPTGTT
jgi:hypothetical protein